jgi:ribosome maturation factor RimP
VKSDQAKDYPELVERVRELELKLAELEQLDWRLFGVECRQEARAMRLDDLETRLEELELERCERLNRRAA